MYRSRPARKIALLLDEMSVHKNAHFRKELVYHGVVLFALPYPGLDARAEDSDGATPPHWSLSNRSTDGSTALVRTFRHQAYSGTFFCDDPRQKGNEVEDGILVCRGLGVEIGRFFFGRLWRGGLDHLQKCGVLAFSLYGPLGQVVA